MAQLDLIIKNHIYNNLYNNFISYTHTETLYNINEKLKKRKKKGGKQENQISMYNANSKNNGLKN